MEHFVYIKNKNEIVESRKFLGSRILNKKGVNGNFLKAVDSENIKTDDQELNFWVKSQIHNEFQSLRDGCIQKLINTETDAKKLKLILSF